MATAPFLPDETVPADDDIVSQYPSAERTFRSIVETWLLVEHDTYGHHKVPSGSTAARDAQDNIAAGNLWLNTDTDPPLLEVYDSAAAAWQSFVAIDEVVIGPGAVTDGAIALFDGASGYLLKEASEGILDTIAQATAEDDTDTDRYIWTAQRVNQAVHAAGVVCLQDVDVDEDATYSTFSEQAASILDNTVPQSGEGASLLSGSFTPQDTNSRIEVNAAVNIGSATNGTYVVWLDVDGTCVKVVSITLGSGSVITLPLNHVIEAADHTTSALTLTVRAAGPDSTNFYNGYSGARFNGTYISHLRAKEWV